MTVAASMQSGSADDDSEVLPEAFTAPQSVSIVHGRGREVGATSLAPAPALPSYEASTCSTAAESLSSGWVAARST